MISYLLCQPTNYPLYNDGTLNNAKNIPLDQTMDNSSSYQKKASSTSTTYTDLSLCFIAMITTIAVSQSRAGNIAEFIKNKDSKEIDIHISGNQKSK